MLRTALGPSIAAWLDDAAVIEVMLNPDGRLWVDRLGEGISDTGMKLAAADGERIVRLVAHHVGVEVHARSPRVSAELPEGGERFEGLLFSAGYLHHEFYDTLTFQRVATSSFLIGEDFPRLRPDGIPSGIQKVTYQLELEACVPFAADIDFTTP